MTVVQYHNIFPQALFLVERHDAIMGNIKFKLEKAQYMEENIKPTVFISHISQEKEVALLLDRAIRDWIGESKERVDIFTSSDKSDPNSKKQYTSINLGDDWFEKILEYLQKSNIILVIATPLSLQRSWVNFEIGAGWVLTKIQTDAQKQVFACCAMGMKKGDLPAPLNRLESADLINAKDVERILSTIGQGTSDRMLQKIAQEFVNDLGEIEKKHDAQEHTKLTFDVSTELGKDPNTSVQRQDVYSHKAGTIDYALQYIKSDDIISNIREHLSVPYDDFSKSSEMRYKKRYQYGQQLAVLNALDDQLTSLTDKRKRPDGSTFRAMKYLVTKRLYERYNPDWVNESPLDAYHPYCLPMTREDNWNFTAWWDRNITPFLSKLRHAPEFSGMSLRLPTFPEWQLLAQKDGGWTYDAVRECNLRLEFDEKREMCAVSVFPNGVSDAGCYDVIGNVWELCLEQPDAQYPSIIAGWSYEDEYHHNPDWWRIPVKLTPIINRHIGFRLIITQ